MTPSSVSWRTGDAVSELDDWVRWLISCAPEDRQRYLDEHQAPALWRRWLDGYLTGKWDNPPAIFWRPDAPMRRLLPLSVPQPDALEHLLDRLERGDTTALAAMPPAIDDAWTRAESPWGMVGLLVWLGRSEMHDAITRMRRIERGEMTHQPVATWLRDRVRRPTEAEVRARFVRDFPHAEEPIA